MPWTEHPGAGAVLGAAKRSVVGISLAGCECIQRLFMGNASFHVIYSPQGGWVGFSVCGAERGVGIAGVLLPWGSPKPMRSPVNRESVGEKEQSVSICGCSGAEDTRG